LVIVHFENYAEGFANFSPGLEQPWGLFL
jgi:hypothetical protein